MKTPSQFLSLIRKLLANGALNPAIAALKELTKNTPQLNEVLQQSGRHTAILKQIRTGELDREEGNIARNQIRVALLELLTD